MCVCVFSRAHEHVGVCMRSRVFVWRERETERQREILYACERECVCVYARACVRACVRMC